MNYSVSHEGIGLRMGDGDGWGLGVWWAENAENRT